MYKFKKIIQMYPIWVYLMVIFAIIIRVIPVKYGLPLHLNIDEPALVSGVLQLQDNPNLGRFDWPHLYFYINFVFYVPAYLLTKYFELPNFLEQDGIYFVVSRLLSAVFAGLTIFVIYSITDEILKSNKDGISEMKRKILASFSAGILSVLPVHVYESFFAKIDVAQTFFVSLSVYWILRSLKDFKLRNFLFIGVFIGLSMSIKYNAFLLYLPFGISYLYHLTKDSIKNIKFYLYPLITGITSIIIFFLGTPFALLDFDTFWSTKPRVGVLWQFQNVGNVPWEEYSMHIYNTFFEMYRSDLGFGLWLFFLLLCVLYLFFNYRDKYKNILLFPAIVISFYISKLDRSPSHYFLFLIPMYLPFLVILASDIIDKINFKKALYSRFVLSLVLIILLVPSVILSLEKVYTFASQDTRLEAYNWVKNNLEQDEYFIYVAGDSLGEVVFQVNRTLKIKSIDPDEITEALPVYLIVGYSEINLNDFRAANWNPKGVSGSSERVLSDDKLEAYFDNKFRSGPPIMIFKITDVGED